MKRLPASYPLAFIIALIALLPVTVLVVLAADNPQLFDARNFAIFTNTILLMVISAIGSIIIGVPLAFLTAYVKLPWPKFWLILFSAPLAIPSYIGAFTIYAQFRLLGQMQHR